MERRTQDERADERKRDNQAMPDELGNNPGQVGPRSAGQSGDPLRLSSLEDAVDESVEDWPIPTRLSKPPGSGALKMPPTIPSTPSTRTTNTALGRPPTERGSR
jgi:hypothetical protein